MEKNSYLEKIHIHHTFNVWLKRFHTHLHSVHFWNIELQQGVMDRSVKKYTYILHFHEGGYTHSFFDQADEASAWLMHRNKRQQPIALYKLVCGGSTIFADCSSKYVALFWGGALLVISCRWVNMFHLCRITPLSAQWHLTTNQLLSHFQSSKNESNKNSRKRKCTKSRCSVVL